jgi:hypothetical protein
MTITIKTFDGVEVRGELRADAPAGAIEITTRITPEITEVARIGLDRIAEVITR